MSLGLLFSGQGTQHAQMLPWLARDALVQRTEAALRVPDWRAAVQDPAWAARNRHVQVLLTGLGLAAWAQLAPALPAPMGVAGYSVGELAAFAAAGVFDADTALELAALRADAMDRAAAQAPGGLLGVTGLGAPAVDELCGAAGVAVAIRIAADAVVLGGPRPALAQAERLAAERGAKCSPLNVEVASHTPAMQPTAEEFAAVLRQRALRPPAVALFCNASGERVHGAEAAAQALARQIAQTVQWAACLEALHARRPSCVLEIGPGAALAAMWNRRYPEIPARSADEFRSGAALQAWVERQG